MPKKPSKNSYRLTQAVFPEAEQLNPEDDIAARELLRKKLQGEGPNRPRYESEWDWEYTVEHFYPDENRWEAGEEPVFGSLPEADKHKKNLETRYKGHKYRVVGRPIIEWQPIYDDQET